MTPWIAARQASLSITNSRSSLRLTSIESMMPSSHLILYRPLLLLPLNPSQHQSLFQWVNSSHEVARVLEFQLSHHAFQRNPRADVLQNGLTSLHPKYYMSCLHSLILKITCFSVIPFRVVRKSPSSLGFCVIGMKQMKGLLRFPSCLPGNERQRTFKMFHQIQQTLFKMSRFHREVARLRGKK